MRAISMFQSQWKYNRCENGKKRPDPFLNGVDVQWLICDWIKDSHRALFGGSMSSIEALHFLERRA